MSKTFILLIIPLAVALIIQVIKIIIEIIKGTFSWKRIIGYGGMPSDHTGLIVSLTTLIALNYGLGSVYFALSFMLTVFIIRDAIGLRRHLADHSKAINKLINDLPDQLEFKYAVLEEKIGHTVSEVTVGAILSIIITYIFYIIIS